MRKVLIKDVEKEVGTLFYDIETREFYQTMPNAARKYKGRVILAYRMSDGEHVGFLAEAEVIV